MKQLVLLLWLAILAPAALAEGAPVFVSGVWSRPTPPGTGTAAVYMQIANPGDTEVAIMGVSTPVAGSAAIHRSVMREGMVGMTPIAGLIIPAHETVALEPGGLHIMLMGLHGALVPGDRFPLTLGVAGGEALTIEVEVRNLEGANPH